MRVTFPASSVSKQLKMWVHVGPRNFQPNNRHPQGILQALQKATTTVAEMRNKGITKPVGYLFQTRIGSFATIGHQHQSLR